MFLEFKSVKNIKYFLLFFFKRYKMVFVGDIYVGKTSIMNRFISNDFKEGYDVNKFI